MVLLVMLTTAGLMAQRLGWFGVRDMSGPRVTTSATERPSSRGSEGGRRFTTTIPPSWTVDIDTGKIGQEGADVHWGMRARGEPYLAAHQGGLLAQVGALAWQEVNAANLASLPYSPAQYLYESGKIGIRQGDVVAVQTGEGRLAKFRIVSLRRDYSADVEWVLYPAPSVRTAAVATPWSRLTEKRDAALVNYRHGQLNETLKLCGEGIAIAEETVASSATHAYILIRCGEMMRLHSLAPSRIEDWLVRGLAIADKLGQARITAELGAMESELILRGRRMLSLLRREQGAALDALRQSRDMATGAPAGGKAP